MLELNGDSSFKVGRERLWALLNDPEVLKRAIPGCNAVERITDDRYRMGLKVQVASVSGEYMGEVEIQDRVIPTHYVLLVGGEGSIGFMKGRASFDLDAREDGSTQLRYVGTAEVGGMVAGVGQRVLIGVARFLVGRFFKGIEKEIDAGTHATVVPVPSTPEAPVEAAPAEPAAATPATQGTA
jgi:carbon monoxide dehydrogenase subunit G